MNAVQLLAHYERIAEAPDAITRLRRLVRELAVRGKLLPQIPHDTPVTLRFRCLNSEGDAGIEDLPANWRAVKVGDALDFQYGKGLPAAKRLASGPIPVFGSNGIVGYTDEPLTKFSAIIVGRKGSAGALNLCTGPSWTTDVAYFVEVPEYLTIRFLLICLQTLGLEALSRGVKPGLSRADAYRLALVLPPLAEQHRIVGKVDELMTLCDRLEDARKEREAARDRLTAASLVCLNAPDPDPATFTTHARFALDSLPALTTRPDQIKRLRQTILRLGLAGKLTKQVASEASATELLERISQLRAKHLDAGYPNAKEAVTQQRKQAEQVLPSTLPAIPLGWEWATLQQCALLVIDCKNKTAPYSTAGIRLIRTTNVRDGKINSIDQKYVTLETYEAWSLRAKPVPGDILVTREAPMGEVCIIPADEVICLGQRMMLARLVPDTINPAFMLYSLRDPDLMDRIQDKPIGMTVQHLRVGGVETLLVALPPLTEQRRIVAKLDELMTLCDRLETCLTTGDQTRQRLLEAILHEALQPAEVRELELA